MDTTTTTSIRVTLENRDQLNDLAREMGIAVPKVVDYLITEDLKRKIIADWDRFREEDPEGWREYLDEAAVWDVTLKDGLETEPPFRSNDQFWLDAGGLPEVNETKDAA
jgi:hypothetical protein